MRNTLLVLFVTCSFLFCKAQEIAMNALEISVLKKQVAATSQKSKTITSNFIQYKHLDFLDNDIETVGELKFKAPGLVRWEYKKPYSYSVIFKENQLLINDGGTKSNVDIGSSKLFKKMNQLIINSVKGDMFDDEDFTVSYRKVEKGNKAVFVPKDKKIAAYIASFELIFSKKTGEVIEVKMVEPSNDYTRIVFSNRVVNSTINDSVFTQ